MSERKSLVNRIRIGLAGLTVLALTGVSAGGATAATSGRGTAAANITLLDVQLGNLQNLKVLTDEGQSTLDAARLGIAGPRAYGQLSAVNATGLVPLKLPDPSFRAEAPGTSNVSLDPMPLSFPPQSVAVNGVTTGVPLGVGLLASGTIDPVKIEAFNDSTGARSFVGTEIPSLDLLQGLINVKNVKVAGLSSSATSSSSTGDSGVLEVGEVNVLDLSALLGSLGKSLNDFNLGTLTTLVDGLNLPVSTGTLGLGSLTGASLLGTVTDVSGLWTTVKSQLAVVQAATDCAALSGVLGVLAPVTSLLGTGGGLVGLGIPLDLSLLSGGCSSLAAIQGPLVTSLTSTLDGLVGTIDGLTDSLFGVLEGAPLLQVSGLKLSALANAAETLAGSSASTSAELGTIKVGGIDLGVLNLNATVAQITDLKNTITSTLSGVTGILGVQFTNLIDIGLMERSASTRAEGVYNVADAAVKALRVSINPPVDLTGALGGVTNLPVSGLLTSIGQVLPADTGLASGVLAQAMGLTSLLTQPTTIVLGSIGAQSDFTTAPAGIGIPGGPVSPPVSGQLPRTGSNNGAWMAAMAAIALAGAFGITKVLRKSPIESQD